MLISSCDEQIKNEYRDDIGHCIPEGQKAIVVLKYTDSPGGETPHFIESEMVNGESCIDLVTVHDFNFIKEGDTISRASARGKCLKIYGEPCNEAYWRKFKLIVYITIFIGIPAFISFVFGDTLNELFRSTYIGSKWYAFRGFISDIIHVNYGFNIFILIIAMAETLIGIVLWNYGIEVHGYIEFQYVVNKLIILTIIGIAWLWIVGGVENLMSNLTIVSLGAIFVSLLTLYIGHLGMSYEDMLKFVLKPQ